MLIPLVFLAAEAVAVDAPLVFGPPPFVEKRSAEAHYRFDGAYLGERSLAAHEVGGHVAPIPKLALGADYADISASGRTLGNHLHAGGWGIDATYTLRPWRMTPERTLAFQVERRQSNATLRLDAGDVSPGTAVVYTVRTSTTIPVGETWTLSGAARGSRVTLGSDLAAWAVAADLGAETRFAELFTLHFETSALRSFGDAARTNLTFSGGVGCGYRIGPFVDASLTAWPLGVPLTGSPVSDPAPLQMNRAVASEPLGRTFASAALGFASIQAGYRVEW